MIHPVKTQPGGIGGVLGSPGGKIGLGALTGAAGGGAAGVLGASGAEGAAINAGLGGTAIGRALDLYGMGKGALGGSAGAPGTPSPVPGQAPSLGMPQLGVSPDMSAMARRMAMYGQ